MPHREPLDVSLLFPEQLRQIGLFDQVLYALQWIVDNTTTDLADSVEKYYDFDILPRELLEEIIKEFGYDYITIILNLTDKQTRDLVSLISLIHNMKGHRDGLLLVLDVIGFQGSVLTEWWEESPEGPVDTFKMTLNLNTSEPLTAGTIAKLLEFIRDYVYPVLIDLQFVLQEVSSAAYALGTADREYFGTADAGSITLPP